MKPIITPEEMADRLDRDADTMDVGRPPVQCTRRKAANMIRQMSLDIAVLKGKGNVWQEAVDHQRVITHLGIANNNATQEEAHKALNEVITWHVEVSNDPAVNGGFSLQPVEAAPTAALPATGHSSAGDLAAVQAEPVVTSVGWREQFSQAVYADLAAADNQDVPLEDYPGRILKVLDSIVGPHHPTVVHWRNDAIRACIEIVKRYGAGTTAYQERDMAALYTAPQAQRADALAEPVAQLIGVDEYGPRLNWFKHWVDLPKKALLYTAPHADVLNAETPYQRDADAQGAPR